MTGDSRGIIPGIEWTGRRSDLRHANLFQIVGRVNEACVLQGCFSSLCRHRAGVQATFIPRRDRISHYGMQIQGHRVFQYFPGSFPDR